MSYGQPIGYAQVPSADVEVVNKALGTLIPMWSQRVSQVLKAPFQFDLDFNAITGMYGGPNFASNRYKIVSSLVGFDAGAENACETFVKAVERSFLDAGAAQQAASQMARIRFVMLQGADKTAKSLVLLNGTLTYSGNFELGSMGCFSYKELTQFFEDKFYARERYLVSKFNTEGLPKALDRMRKSSMSSITLMMNVPAMVEKVPRDKRLAMIEFLISRVGMKKVMGKVYDSATKSLSSMAASFEKALVGSNDQFVADSTQNNNNGDVFNSPSVLEPIVQAIEEVCAGCPQNQQLLGRSMSCIQIVLSSSGARSLGIRSTVTAPPIAPNKGGPTQVSRGHLIYECAFENGSKGVFSKSEILNFLEEHFRFQEQKMVMSVVSKDLPKFNERVRACTSSGVLVEMLWPTIFHDGLDLGKPRIAVAETFCNLGSALVVEPLVSAIERLHSRPGMQQVLSSRIAKVVIQSTPGRDAKPSIYWGPGQGLFALLIYQVAGDRGSSGCFSEVECGIQLASLFGVPPPNNTSVDKAMSNVAKVGTEAMGKAFSALGFGKKKK